MKRIFSLALVFALFVSILPVYAMAAEQSSPNNQTIGDPTLEITLFDFSTGSDGLLTRGFKSGQKAITLRDDLNNVLWTATLTALFSYNGVSSLCTDAGCGVTINDSSFYVVSKSATYSGNTATAQITIGHRFLGVTVNKTSYTITLSCDKDGNLS